MKTALSSKNCMVGEEEEGTINNGRNERKKTDNFGLGRLTRIAFQTTDPSFLFLTCSAENCSDPVSLHMVHAKNNKYAAYQADDLESKSTGVKQGGKSQAADHQMGDNPCGASKGGCDACTPALEKTGGYGADHSRSRHEHHNQGCE